MNQNKSTSRKSPENTEPVGGAPITPPSRTVLAGLGVLTAVLLPIGLICWGVINP